MNITSLKKEFAESARNNLKEAREAVKRVRSVAGFAARLHLAMKKVAKGQYVSSFAGSSGRIYVAAHLKVASFKDDPSLLACLSSGIEIMGGSAKFRSTDYADSGSREYVIETDNVSLTINASLIGEGSESCRRVEIGREMVEVKKYKFVCEGEPSEKGAK